MKTIILASSSPRRIEMMKQHGYDPQIQPAQIDETLPFAMAPRSAVMYLAFKKASHVLNQLTDSSAKAAAPAGDRIILAADTIVLHQNKIIGKPADRQEAFAILSALRNDCHHVITGVCIIQQALQGSSAKVFPRKICFYEDTAVYFKDYSDEELSAYVDTPEPYDKAGGYAIQETFRKYIDHIEGDFDNVVGFPWSRIEPYIL